MNTEKIGAFIKEQRKNKNLTQKELAEILSCTDKAISRWETGRGVPEISLLIPLSDALGISVNELLLGEKIEKEKLEEKTEQLIIETITETHKKTGDLKNMIYALLIIIEAITFFVPPLIAGPTDPMGVAVVLFIGTIFTGLLMGFCSFSLKKKLLFALIVIGLFIPSTFMPYYGGFNEDLLLYYTPALVLFYLACMLLTSGIRLAVKKIFKK